jgi:protein-disulfide isomerase
MNKGVLAVLVILVAAAIGFGGWYAYQGSQVGAPPEAAQTSGATTSTSGGTATSAATGTDTAGTAATDVAMPVIGADEMTLGNADAPVTIVEYFSLGCVHCKHFHEEILPQLKAEYIDTGKVRIVFRDFPLDGVALAAAQLSRCVSPMAYHPMVDTIFKQQNDWHIQDGVKVLANIAKGAGMDQAAFDACIGNTQLREKIIAGTKEGADQFKIEATPTFIINGKKLSGVGEYAPFKEAVEAALAGK